ncbi:MAG TPA: hypothetical protein VF868_09170 [Bacteroidia bacterium]|jgi:general stress protein CsbA
MRRRISTNIRVGRLLILPLTVGLLILNIYVFFISDDKLDNSSSFIISGISVIFMVIGYFLYKYLDNEKTIEYDDNNMYVSGKFGTKEIQLAKITSLIMTPTRLNDNFKWKIIYIDKDNTEGFVIFFSRPLNVNLADFSKAIMTKNSDAKVQGFSFGPFQVDKTNN